MRGRRAKSDVVASSSRFAQEGRERSIRQWLYSSPRFALVELFNYVLQQKHVIFLLTKYLPLGIDLQTIKVNSELRGN